MSGEIASFVSRPDYGPEIVPGARVMDSAGRRGVVVVIRDGCHWNCGEWADQWRSRAAYVEWDDSHGQLYCPPESLSRIPAEWGPGVGLVHGPWPRGRMRGFQPTVVRLRLLHEDASAGDQEWHVMNRQARGWGESSYAYPTWRALLHAWDFVRGEPGEDEHGLFIPVRNR